MASVNVDRDALPSDVQAERAVLGSILLDRDAIAALVSKLQPNHFFMERHSEIYAVMLACFDNRTPPDLVNVATMLRQRGAFEQVGGASYLIELSNSVPTATHVEYYARAVMDAWFQRTVIDKLGKTATTIYQDRTLTPAQISATLDSMTRSLAAPDDGEILRSAADIANMVGADIQRSVDNPGSCSSNYLTGIASIDERWSNILTKQHFIIIMGRPGEYKSAIAQQIATHQAQRVGPAAYFTLEMTYKQQVARYCAQEHGISQQWFDAVDAGDPASTYVQDLIRDGVIREFNDMVVRVQDALGEMAKLPLWISERKNVAMADIRRSCSNLMMRCGPLACIVVDYLQLVEPFNKRDPREQQVAEISRDCVRLAGEFDCPVIGLSQMNRDIVKSHRPPQLSDLRESGALEQDAAKVLAPYRPSMHDEDQPDNLLHLYVLKHRDAATGMVPLAIDKTHLRLGRWSGFVGVEGYM